ncbi:hypothetical protein [Pseudomonas sp. DC3000-4b1]|uniref:hypothetical protein n=1 Tax=unclassified Pseudomonas TaxID=196821 RepID=UPI003CE94649
MIQALLLTLTALSAFAQAATEPPAPIEPAPPVPVVAPATPSVQGGASAVASPAPNGVALPEVELPQPPNVSPAAQKGSAAGQEG